MKILVLFDLYRRPGEGELFSARTLERVEDKPTEADVLRALGRLGHEVESLAVFDNVGNVLERLAAFRPDVVFNLSESFHRSRAQEPNIPALLELMKVRYRTGRWSDRLVAVQGRNRSPRRSSRITACASRAASCPRAAGRCNACVAFTSPRS